MSSLLSGWGKVTQFCYVLLVVEIIVVSKLSFPFYLMLLVAVMNFLLCVAAAMLEELQDRNKKRR